MCFHASTTTLNLYANLYYAKTKWLLFETKDSFQKCNSTIKTLLGLKTAAKDIWNILGRTKSSLGKQVTRVEKTRGAAAPRTRITCELFGKPKNAVCI